MNSIFRDIAMRSERTKNIEDINAMAKEVTGEDGQEIISEVNSRRTDSKEIPNDSSKEL